MKSSGAGLIASTLPLIVLLAGCASSSRDQGRVVVGSGSNQDRQTIESSDQQMVQLERSGLSSPPAGTTAPAETTSTPPVAAAPPDASSAPAPTEPPLETP